VRRLARAVLVVALLGGTASAFAVTEALKLERSPVTAPRFDERFSPVCSCRTSVARLSLRFRVADRVDAVIVDRDAEPVRTLVEDRGVRRGRAAFEWDGRDEAGRVVPDGPYRLRVHLDEERRTILVPNEVEVDTRPPSVGLVRASRRIVSPDGDRRGDRLKLVYRASERAGPLLLVDGEVAAEERARRRRSSVRWDGTLDGRVLRPGLHLLAVRVRDEAGNLSAPTEAVPVRLRYVALTRNVIRVARGGRLRLRVDTDAASYGWSLRRRTARGVGRTVLAGVASRSAISVRLPRRLERGRYVLRVSVGGHKATALVLIVRRR
jgi:hypothetical protein